MASPSQSVRCPLDRLLTFCAALLLCFALAFGAAFAWHTSQAGSYRGTFIVVSGWAAGGFILASLVVAAGALVGRYRAAPAFGTPRFQVGALWLVASAWLVIALVWALSRA